MGGGGFTRLTSVSPSNWNLGKIFALTGPLGQVYMVKKIFEIPLYGSHFPRLYIVLPAHLPLPRLYDIATF